LQHKQKKGGGESPATHKRKRGGGRESLCNTHMKKRKGLGVIAQEKGKACNTWRRIKGWGGWAA